VELDETSMALDVIDAVGPGGAFLDIEHTRRNYRAAQWIPRLIDRRRWNAWRDAGGPTMTDRLNAEVLRILESHHPEPLPVDKAREIAKILAAREAQDAREKRRGPRRGRRTTSPRRR
jgi:trimethylamine--corrinoid protein Co-methyltransferase